MGKVDWQGVDALRGVDADQTHGLSAAGGELHHDGVAVGDALDGGEQGAGWDYGPRLGWFYHQQSPRPIAGWGLCFGLMARRSAAKGLVIQR